MSNLGEDKKAEVQAMVRLLNEADEDMELAGEEARSFFQQRAELVLGEVLDTYGEGSKEWIDQLRWRSDGG